MDGHFYRQKNSSPDNPGNIDISDKFDRSDQSDDFDKIDNFDHSLMKLLIHNHKSILLLYRADKH